MVGGRVINMICIRADIPNELSLVYSFIVTEDGYEQITHHFKIIEDLII